MATLGTTLRELRAAASDALLPQRCVACGRFGAALHLECLERLPRAEQPRCAVCWRPGTPSRESSCEMCAVEPPVFDELRTPFRFDGLARRALLEAKFRGLTALLEPLGIAAARVVPQRWAVEAVTWAPLHASRRRRRGFDQAELMARSIAAQLQLPLRGDLLRRGRPTAAQSALEASARARNIEGAFEAAGIASRPVLLVDDVTTTGATLEAAARALRDAGAERVYALAVARED